MLRILYIGLSNNIRGVVETLSDDGRLAGFVKPGEDRSRAVVAKQSISNNPVDLIVIGDAAAGVSAPQFVSVVRNLRADGVEHPILCFTNAMTETVHQEFMDAGGDVLLPFFRKNAGGHYIIKSATLNSQIARMAAFVPVHAAPDRAVEKPIATESLSGANGTMLNPLNQSLLLAGREILLLPREWKLFQTLASNEKVLVTGIDLWRAIEPQSQEADGRELLSKTVLRFHKRLRKTFDHLEGLKRLQLVESVPNKGWRISQDTLAYIFRAEQGTPISDLFADGDLEKGSPVVTFADVSVNMLTRQASVHGQPLDLEPQKARILGLIAKAQGRIVSQNKLFLDYYGDNVSSTPQSFATNVRQCVASFNQQAKIITDGVEKGLTRPMVKRVEHEGWQIVSVGPSAADGNGEPALPDVAFAHVSVKMPFRQALFYDRPLDLSPQNVKILGLVTMAQGEIISEDKLFHEYYGDKVRATRRSFSMGIHRCARSVNQQIQVISGEMATDNSRPKVQHVLHKGWRLIG